MRGSFFWRGGNSRSAAAAMALAAVTGVIVAGSPILSRLHARQDVASPAPPQNEASSRQAHLAAIGIDTPDEASLRDYLNRLIPSVAIEEQVGRLLRDLSDDSFTVREQASERLRQLPGLTIPALSRRMENASHPEIRLRLKEALDALQDPLVARAQLAVFEEIEKAPRKNLASAIADAAPYLARQTSVSMAAARALAVTAVASDQQRLRQILLADEVSPWLRIGALKALLRIDPGETRRLLPRLAETARAAFAIEVAKQLALNENPITWDLLIRLTVDADLATAREAWLVLRRMTGTNIAFDSLQHAESRSEAIDRLRRYMADNKEQWTFEWRGGHSRLGKFLIADYQNGIVREFDEAGRVTWSHEERHPFACQGLANGHRLVTAYDGQQLLEFDERGDPIQSTRLLHSRITAILRLDNGNTLVSSHGNIPIVEYSPQGVPVREIAVAGTVSSMEMLDHGNFLISLFEQKRVAGIDPAGNTIWSLPLDALPYSATQTTTGNLLVTAFSADEVREYTMDGRVLWVHKTTIKPFRADRLDDGSTLIACPNGLVAVEQNGTVRELTPGLDFGETLFFNSF